MGLCKCPKRKVTNLFCFEHRVNVCEHCLIENHPRCVVQSYLSWLKDSDYNPNCALCNITLAEGDVIRLLCYDVFHISCLEKHFRALPSNTAPAGYKCVSCNTPIFPAQNQAGLVTDNLKEVLSKYNWARVGLCLPLIDEPTDKHSDKQSDKEQADDSYLSHEDDIYDSNSLQNHLYEHKDSFISEPQLNSSVDHSYSNDITTWSNSNEDYSQQNHITPQSPPQNHSTVLNIDHVAPHASGDTVTVARKGGREVSLGGMSLGHEDADGANKYQRRSALTWFRRWLKSRSLPGRSYTDSRMLPRRAFVLILIGLIAFLTFIVFATKVGRGSTSDDPKFDPLFNPNIHVARHKRDPFVDYDVIEDPLQKLQGLAGGAR